MDECCNGRDLEAIGLNPEPVRQLWREFLDGREHRPDLLWQVFMLVGWTRQFVTTAVAAAHHQSR
jgi:hypothetical protein